MKRCRRDQRRSRTMRTAGMSSDSHDSGLSTRRSGFNSPYLDGVARASSRRSDPDQRRVLSALLGVGSDALNAGSLSSYRLLTGELLLDANHRYQEAQRLWAEGGGPPN